MSRGAIVFNLFRISNSCFRASVIFPRQTAILIFTQQRFAGHNKWSKIHRKKAIADTEKSQFRAKCMRSIRNAVKYGGSTDPNINFTLKTAIERAKDQTIPRNIIEKAIKYATNNSKDDATQKLYCLKCPIGFIMIVESFSANQISNKSHINRAIKKTGCTLLDDGVESTIFSEKGIIDIGIPDEGFTDPEALAIEVDAEEIKECTDEKTNTKFLQLTCDRENLGNMNRALVSRNISILNSKCEYIPLSYVELEEDKIDNYVKILDRFNVIEDVHVIVDNVANGLDMT